MASTALERAEDWVARYNGPGNDPDGASAITVDSLGNVYVAGRSDGIGTDYDYATVKYDNDGNQLWVARYSGPGGFGDDSASAIAVDPLGNVYVTGRSDGIGTDYDYATVKYDTSGNQLWVKRYNGPENDADEAIAIAIDASGNVYVFGKSRSSTTNFDYATVKYDSNGNQRWVARYSGPGGISGDDSAIAIAVDALGNVYVTGWSWSGKDYDYATVKYDSNGNQRWVARYNSPRNWDDTPSDIAVDPLGNIYVTGTSEGSGTGSDYATVKYDSNGNQRWVAEYNGPGDLDDWANAIAVDVSGNIYVTGTSEGSGTGSDYATVKYDTGGNQRWVARYNGPENDSDGASAIAVDTSGNLYVAGKSGSWLDYDYATVKYDTGGNQLWVARYNGPGNKRDRANAITIDTSGNVYVTGESDGSGTGSDYATMKYGNVNKFELTIELPKAWSMISLPVKPQLATVASLFPGAEVMFKYEKTGYERIQEDENLEVGIGYWILLCQPQSYVIKGSTMTEFTIPVEDGWNMIGGCSFPVQKKMLSHGNIDVIFEYTPGGYERVPDSEPLEPGKAYWFFLRNISEGAEFTASTSISE